MIRKELACVLAKRTGQSISTTYHDMAFGFDDGGETFVVCAGLYGRAAFATFNTSDITMNIERFAEKFLVPLAKKIIPAPTKDESISLYLDDVWAKEIKPILIAAIKAKDMS